MYRIWLADVDSFTNQNIFKNLGRLWLGYTELQGDFYMLQLMPKDVGLL